MCKNRSTRRFRMQFPTFPHVSLKYSTVPYVKLQLSLDVCIRRVCTPICVFTLVTIHTSFSRQGSTYLTEKFQEISPWGLIEPNLPHIYFPNSVQHYVLLEASLCQSLYSYFPRASLRVITQYCEILKVRLHITN